MKKCTVKNNSNSIFQTMVFLQSVTALISSLFFLFSFFILNALGEKIMYMFIYAFIIGLLIILGSFFPFISIGWSFCYFVKKIVKKNFALSDLIPFAISLISLVPCISMYNFQKILEYFNI